MDWVVQHLFEAGWLSLREVLRLLLLSGLFTVACLLAFPRNAPTRRLLLLAAVTVLMVLPWLLAAMDAVWYVTWETLPAWTLATAIPNVLLWIWLAVAAFLLMAHIYSVRGELAQLQQLPELSDPQLCRLTEELAQRLSLPPPQIKQGEVACSTTLAGSVLVLPADWRRWSALTLRSVVAHELTHIRRRDDRWLLLTRALVLTYWWMPWLMLLYRLYVRVMEESCDDMASATIGHDLSYVGALVDAAVPGADSADVAYENVTGMYQHHLVGRVGRFRRQRDIELNSRGLYWCVLGILLIVVALTGIEPVMPVARPHTATAAATVTHPVAPGSVIYPKVHVFMQLAQGQDPALQSRLAAPIQTTRAVYPGHAIRAGVQGDVVISSALARDGSVVGAQVLSSQPAGVFEQAALAAVRNTRYRPSYQTDGYAQVASRQQQPLPSQVRIQHHFYFRLDTQ